MTPSPAPFDPKLVAQIYIEYQLDWEGLHGASHWARVLQNGMHICDHTPEVRRDVVTLFALFHDSCRNDDGEDKKHGVRSALFVKKLHKKHISLDDEGMELLMEACRTHTGGRGPADPTVMACWDSDRLDLPRIWGITVNPFFLGTPIAMAPETIEAATKRAQARLFPWKSAFMWPWA